MKQINKFYILGGDLRQLKLAESLREDGFGVKTFGFERYIDVSEKQDLLSELEGVRTAECLILPLPIAEGQEIPMPLSDRKVGLRQVLSMVRKDCKIFGGKIPSEAYDMAAEYSLDLYDYMEREEMAVLNAVPTAEGAIEIAISEMPTTLWKSRVLIAGYGRVGKALVTRLSSFGCTIDVAARKCSDAAWIESLGLNFVPMNELLPALHQYDLIINTVPSKILTKERMEKLKPDCLLIDLASKPGGIDFEGAKELSIKAIWALSLPGRIAPVTAGDIIKQTIQNMLREMEG